MEMKGKKKCWFYILVPLVAGAAAGMISGSGMAAYEQMAKPPLSPPGWVFPVVWTILYILMGIAACLVAKSYDPDSQEAIRAFWVQLIVNVIWPILFLDWGSAVWLLGGWCCFGCWYFGCGNSLKASTNGQDICWCLICCGSHSQGI